MKPERYVRCSERFEPMRANLNHALLFAGLAVDCNRTPSSVEQARTLPEAERRARELENDLAKRGVHPDVLRFCRAELVGDDYFHAVLEATKSIADKLAPRARAPRPFTGETGAALVDRALGGDLPLLAVDALDSGERAGGAARLRQPRKGRVWHVSEPDRPLFLASIGP